jgi:CheY-like chemotaxis protein
VHHLLLIDRDGGQLAQLARELARQDGVVLHVASDAAHALEVLAAEPCEAMIARLSPSEAPTLAMQHEILVRSPWLVQIQLSDPPIESPLLGATGWSERPLAWPCTAERVLSEISAALARRDRDRLRRPGSASASSTCAGAEPVALVIEDSTEELELLRQALRQGGCGLECWAVESGTDALAFLAREERFARAPEPHVIVLDLLLPRMNGYEFLARYRATSTDPVPVVVLSSALSVDQARAAVRHGAAACVPRPCTWDRYLGFAVNLDRIARLTLLARGAQQKPRANVPAAS